MSKPKLPLQGLADRHIGLTTAIADTYSEAARVCLDRHHRSPVDFSIDSTAKVLTVVAEWDAVTDRIRRAWANEIDATEAGAYACALAAVEICAGLVAVHRAETRTGADYYVAPIGVTPDDLESCFRLEVSGVDHGNKSDLRRRLKSKLAQAGRGASNLPAMAGVVGFDARVVLMAALDDT